jgi:hypothetical protein
LDKNIVGIYKKPNSDKLYVATLENIFQISESEIVTLKTITSISDSEVSISRTTSFYLYQNYPNPFNASTKIQYQINRPGKVKIVLYSSDGRFVKKLVDEDKKSGKFSIIWNAKGLASGVYFYALIHNGDLKHTKRLLLIK